MDYSDWLDYREASRDALLAQLVEHSIRNAGVRSSNLLEGTTFSIKVIPHNNLYFSKGKFRKSSLNYRGLYLLNIPYCV